MKLTLEWNPEHTCVLYIEQKKWKNRERINNEKKI